MTRFPIQPAKVRRPPLPHDILRRERLLDWLDIKVHNRVVLVTAEAGYGKTTTLADWSRRTRVQTLWYRLDEDDADWVSFLNYLVAAGRVVDGHFAPNTAALLQDVGAPGATRDAILESFLRELPALVAAGPLVMIFDDFHLVDESEDVRLFFRDLLARIPERLTLILLSRRTPNIPLARLRGRGEVAELWTDDLRFDVGETEQLFRDTYKRPLERDVLTELSRRTDGWAASLQLVQTALRGRTSAETRAFVRNITSAQGELYDYLAEEVVGDLPADLQKFLMRTSILQAVDVELAALVAEVDRSGAKALMDRAELLGLLSSRTAAGNSVRYHPLVREFLETRLRREEGDEQVRDLHLRVATSVETRSWRISVHHYDVAGAERDVFRVLTSAIPSIMAAGDWETASPYLDVPGLADSVEFEMIRSRVALGRGEISRALDHARRAGRTAETSDFESARFLAMANLSAVEWAAGNLAESLRLASILATTDGLPQNLAEISRVFAHLHQASVDADLRAVRDDLRELGQKQKVPGQAHYYAITMLNLANCLRAMGDASGCLEAASEAVQFLTQTAAGYELGSAHVVRAWALAHLGDLGGAKAEIDLALRHKNPMAQLEVYAEAADALGMYGDPLDAQRLLDEASQVRDASAADREILTLATSQNLLRLGRNDEAVAQLRGITPMAVNPEQGHAARLLTVQAEIAFVLGADDAASQADSASVFAARQGAGLFEPQAEILLSLLGGKADLDAAISRVAREDVAFLTVMAHRLAPRLGDLDATAYQFVTDEARRRPERWRSAIRASIADSPPINRIRAGALLDEIGTSQDVPLLRSIAKGLKRQGSGDLGVSLARRVAARIEVFDLGRVSIAIGDQLLPGTSIRRKALALLCFMLTTTDMSATRDQVLEALWPDQEPSAALNSLNQTVYFVRRVLEPDYVEEYSPGYLHHDSDVLWLDPELVTSRSRKCRALARLIGASADVSEARSFVNLYTAPFALDFAYDDWAGSYRDTLHATFLEITERAIQEGVRRGAFLDTIALTRQALDVDPAADQLEASLLHLYRLIGAHAAAAEQYGHYAALLRDELGVEPPPLEEVSGWRET